MTSVYVHVPFCLAKCDYCDFYSLPCGGGARDRVNGWFDVVRREMLLWADAGDLGREEAIDTLFIGGGTPSLASASTMDAFLGWVRSEFGLSPDAEITVEMRPGTADSATIAGYARAGVTRFSVGVQTFDQTRLDLVGRFHLIDDARQMLRVAREHGVLSLDLISCWPGQTVDDWRREMDEALSWAPPHVSAYELTFHEETRLLDNARSGRVSPLDEDVRLAVFEETARVFGEAGYEHYEISNYAKPGMRSRHNENYWRLGKYIGLGAGAHSFVFPHRYANPDDVGGYEAAIGEGRLARRMDDAADCHIFALENLQMALRLADGVDLDWFSPRFGEDIRNSRAPQLAAVIDGGLAVLRGSRLSLTPRGFAQFDSVIGALV